jgi:molybdopterin converting factor small subunit
MKDITIELLGIARRQAGIKQVSVELTEQATYHDLLRRLANLYPALLGKVINPQTYELMPAFMLNLNGRRAISNLDTPVGSGERLVLMFMESGG